MQYGKKGAEVRQIWKRTDELFQIFLLGEVVAPRVDRREVYILKPFQVPNTSRQASL
jgi:hypothetical protein